MIFKMFFQKESRPDNDYAARLKREKTRGDRYMFPNVYFFCMEYRLQLYKQTCYLFQYPSKLLLKQQMQKSKLALPKRWKENSSGYCRCLPGGRCLLGYCRCFTPVLFSHQFLLQDFAPVLNSVLNSATGSSYSLTSLCTSLLLVTGMLQ